MKERCSRPEKHHCLLSQGRSVTGWWRNRKSFLQDSSLTLKGNSAESGSGCNAFSIPSLAIQSSLTNASSPPLCPKSHIHLFLSTWHSLGFVPHF